MVEQQLGPYYDRSLAESVARSLAGAGQQVKLYESYEPYQPKRKQHSFYVFREVLE